MKRFTAYFGVDQAGNQIRQEKCVNECLFILFLNQNCLLSTHNMFWLRNKKINFQLCTLYLEAVGTLSKL